MLSCEQNKEYSRVFQGWDMTGGDAPDTSAQDEEYEKEKREQEEQEQEAYKNFQREKQAATGNIGFGSNVSGGSQSSTLGK